MSHPIPARPPIRAVVFDLDDTLFDCLGQCVGPAHREAARAMVEAGARASVEELLEARLALAGVEHDVDAAVAAAFRSVNPIKVAEAGRQAFFDRDPGSIVPFPFAADVVARVRAVARAILLSVGHPPTQRRKLGGAGARGRVRRDPARRRRRSARRRRPTLAAWLRSGRASRRLRCSSSATDRTTRSRPRIRLGMQALRIRGGEFAARPTPVGVAEAGDVRAVLGWLGERPTPPARPESAHTT